MLRLAKATAKSLSSSELLEPSAVEDGDRARWSRRRSGSYGDSDGIQRSTRPD